MAEEGESRVENVVEYQIYDSTSIKSSLNNLQDSLYDIVSYVNSLIIDYIWQNEAFNLQISEELVKSNNGVNSIQCFQGSTNFGDNIEDEWFIVYILFKVTKRFPDMVAKVSDNDGEFLLIETANYLPDWLEPETSGNRVFIYQGHIHIIPLPSNPSEITIFPVSSPTIHEALDILKLNADRTIALPLIQECVKNKVEEYPEKIHQSFHHVVCYLPKTIRYLLQTTPSLIAPAILAFIEHSMLYNQVKLKLVRFPFEFLVPHRVRFTKCLYGQLIKLDVKPDPLVQTISSQEANMSLKGCSLGFQITYGFELLYNRKQWPSHAPMSPPGNTPNWEKYLSALQQHGYFRNEITGSKLYCKLLQQAKSYFARNFPEKDVDHNQNFIEDLLKKMTNDNINVHDLTPESLVDDDDDESWLEISTQDLESMLSKYGCMNHKDYNNSHDLANIVQGVNSFVDTESQYDGIDLSDTKNFKTEIDFNSDDFLEKMKNLLTYDDNSDKDCDDDDSSDLSFDRNYNEYLNELDEELSNTDIPKSFVRVGEHGCEKSASGEVTNGNETKPIDMDLNLVQNFLESYALQEGMSGPVSNIMNSIGIPLPSNVKENA